jgi:hypothetical protein
MDHDTDGDGAINLSTSQRPSASTTPNGSLDLDDGDQVRLILYSRRVRSLFRHIYATMRSCIS